MTTVCPDFSHQTAAFPSIHECAMALTGHSARARRLFAFSLALVPVFGLAAGCMPPGGIVIKPVPADRRVEEQMVQKSPRWISDRVAIIDISGILLNGAEPGLFSEGENAVSFTVEKLAAAEADKRVKAVVLRINSPGGTVTASDILYEEIRAFKGRSKKPVVAYFMDVAASGAYYLSCAADEIVAQQTSVTGSIGVVMQMVEFSGTMTKLGISADAITSGTHKDSGSPLRKMRPEERELFQNLVNGFYGRFLDVVVAGRPKLDRETITKLADGRVYIAKEALEAGLIDRVGTIQDAIALAREKAGLKYSHVVIYRRPLGWSPNVYALPPGGPATVNLVNVNLPKIWTGTPQFLYIWGASK